MCLVHDIAESIGWLLNNNLKKMFWFNSNKKSCSIQVGDLTPVDPVTKEEKNVLENVSQ